MINKFYFILLALFTTITLSAKESNYTVNKDITFKTINSKDIKLDLYVPKVKKEKYPLLVWVHGGAWKRGTKDNIPKKNPLLLNSFLKEGYALASIDYRLSGEASFPAPVKDINDAINFLYDNASKYRIDVENIAIMGRSAGGHLACLLGASNSNNVDFYSKPKYKVVSVVSFFGPTDLLALGNKGDKKTSKKSSVSRFLGDIPSDNPELAKKASVTTYITKKSPAFILLHGDIDKQVPLSQSTLLKELLDKNGIENKLFIEKGVGHSDKVFDTEKYVPEVVSFVKKHLPSK